MFSYFSSSRKEENVNVWDILSSIIQYSGSILKYITVYLK